MINVFRRKTWRREVFDFQTLNLKLTILFTAAALLHLKCLNVSTDVSKIKLACHVAVEIWSLQGCITLHALHTFDRSAVQCSTFTPLSVAFQDCPNNVYAEATKNVGFPGKRTGAGISHSVVILWIFRS